MGILDAPSYSRAETDNFAYIDFTTKANGAAPLVLDTGQIVVADAGGKTGGSLPVIAGGGLSWNGTLNGGGNVVTYYQAALGAKATRAGATWVQPAGDSGNSTPTLILWDHVYTNADAAPPGAVGHLTMKAVSGNTWLWNYYVGDGKGGATDLYSVASGNFTAPARDGVTVWSTEFNVDTVNGVVYVQLPDQSIVTITQAQIDAAYTALGGTTPTDVKLANMGAAVLVVEHFHNPPGATPVPAIFLSMWAELARRPRHKTRSVNPLALQKSLYALQPAATPYMALKVHTPSTQYLLATTNTKASVDAANFRIPAITPGPSAKLWVEVSMYYEFTATDNLYWQITVFGVGDIPEVLAYHGVAGENVIVRQVMEIDAAAGVPAELRLKHRTFATMGAATAIIGGTGGAEGSRRPPATMRAWRPEGR